MISYRDKTFCVSQECDKRDECDRHLNVLNKSGEKQIDIPLSMSDLYNDQTGECTV